MGTVDRLLGGRKDAKERYACWMCDESYVQPGEFLAHIRECKARRGPKRILRESLLQE